MAHSPKVKAACVADLCQGMSVREAAAKHKVSPGTVGKWAVGSKTTQNDTSRLAKVDTPAVTEAARANQFDDLLRSFLLGTLQMLNSWVTLLQDPAFVKDKPTAANELGTTVLDRADRLVALIRPAVDLPNTEGERLGDVHPGELPARSDGPVCP